MDRKTLGHFTQGETKCNENKAFHLQPHTLIHFRDDDIYDLVDTGIWTDEFRLVEEKNLLDFISLILPKYITCWANAKIDGVLNIGVDDSCEISGVPIIGEIPKEKILETIARTIKENLQSESALDKIMEMIELEYHELDHDLTILSPESDNYVKKFGRDIRDYNDKLDEYTIKQGEFLIRHRQYTQKLEFILNTTKYRIELADYIEKDNNSDSKEIIEWLRSSTYIKLKTKNIHEDRSNPGCIFYWIVKFRDDKSVENGLLKPYRPMYPSLYHFRQILCNLPCMRYKFLEINHNLKYYIIKIKCRVGGFDSEFKFRDQYSNKWLYRTRIANVEIKLGEVEIRPGCI